MEFRPLKGLRRLLPRVWENKVEERFVNVVLGMGGWPIKLRLIGLAGFPDRMVLWKGRRIDFVELKRPKGAPRALQLRVHKRLGRYGFEVHIIRSFEDVDVYAESHETC